MEQTIEKLCEKFGVTVENLVTELFKYHITIDWVSLAIWFVIIVIIIILCKKYKAKWIKACEDNDGFVFAIIVPFAVGFIGIITIPYIIIDLIGWYVSPIASALSILMSK